MLEDFQKFKDHKVKAKTIFNISEISKNDAYDFIKTYHYLGDAKFFSNYSYGLFYDGQLVGVTTFTNPQGTMTLKGWFNLESDDHRILELSRLCVLPELNGTNATSYLLSNSMKLLKSNDVWGVITLADESRHVGSIYQVCNFKYYGLTNKKSDFYRFDGKVNPRGKTKGVRGVWLPRTRKHRYAFMFTNKLEPLFDEQPRPTLDDTTDYNLVCCDGKGLVYDKRFNEWFNCPICSDITKEVCNKRYNVTNDDLKPNITTYDTINTETTMNKHFILSKLAEVSLLADANHAIASNSVSKQTAEDAEEFIKKVLENEFGIEKQLPSVSTEDSEGKIKPKSNKTRKAEGKVTKKEDEESDTKEEKEDVPETVDTVESDDNVVVEEKPTRTLRQMIEELPEGDDLLAKPPYSYFALVPKNVAERYLSGVKISEVTDANTIAEASKIGVDKDFVQLLLDAHEGVTNKVEKPIKTDEGSKARQLVDKLAPKIDKGEELFNIMSRGGVDGTTMKHFAKIVETVVKKGA